MAKGFTRTIEDFVCGHCGANVVGNGYTNHCPKCLWSKHVDKNPGDREETCEGMMEPIGIEKKDKEYIILQKCQKCGFTRNNKVGKEDDFDAVLDLSRKLSSQ